MNNRKKTMHVHASKGIIGDYAVLVEGPEQVRRMVKKLEGFSEVAHNREYLTYSGFIDGASVSITSAGIGGPSVAIAVEELVECGAKFIIKVGECDSVHNKVRRGDLVIPNGAVRMEGVTNHYTLIEYPAVPDMAVVRTIEEEIKAKGLRFHVGVNISRANYSILSDHLSGKNSELLMQWNACLEAGAISTEFDAAVVFIICESLKIPCGAILVSVSDNRKYSLILEDSMDDLMENAYDVALRTIRNLIQKSL